MTRAKRTCSSASSGRTRRFGVSPWYFFADVPVKKRRCVSLPAGYCKTDWPCVQYRGIFLNDEEELDA